MPSGVYPHKIVPVRDRFLRFLARTIKPKFACWIWPGTKNVQGYGVIFIAKKGKHTKIVYAYREAYKVLVGPFPSHFDVCHHCDTPGCIRPSHLFLGHHHDNMSDGVAKGRFRNNGQNSPKGSDHPNSKLTEREVRQMRVFYASGKWAMLSLAKKFGVSIGNVYRILRGRGWKHYKQSRQELAAKTARICKKITPGQFKEIRRKYRVGAGCVDLARKFNVTPTRICQIGRYGK